MCHSRNVIQLGKAGTRRVQGIKYVFDMNKSPGLMTGKYLCTAPEQYGHRVGVAQTSLRALQGGREEISHPSYRVISSSHETQYAACVCDGSMSPACSDKSQND